MESFKSFSKAILRPPTPGNPVPGRSKLANSPYRIPSEKIISKHRPLNSYAVWQPEKTKIKESASKPLLKSSQDSRMIYTKSVIGHRKSASISDKTKSAQLADPDFFHHRKYSVDCYKEIDVISSFSHKSYTGYSPDNPSKVNQDNFITLPALKTDFSFFAVADGHGVNGKEVSSYIKEKFPILLIRDPSLSTNPSKSLSSCAFKLNTDLAHQGFDVNFSGSTFVSILIHGKKL